MMTRNPTANDMAILRLLMSLWRIAFALSVSGEYVAACLFTDLHNPTCLLTPYTSYDVYTF